MAISGICELTLETRDRDRLERFYVDVLGLEVASCENDRTWLGVGNGARLGLWTPGEKEHGDEGGRHVHFAFATNSEGIDALTDRLRESGADPKGPVEHDGGDRSLYVEDPEGNVVEFWAYREGAGDAPEPLAGNSA